MSISRDMRVLITGASSGFGFEMSKVLLQAGAMVAMASRPGCKLDAAVERLRAEGLNPYPLPMDVRMEDSVFAAATDYFARWDYLDMLVNNAGVGMTVVNPDFAVKPLLFFELDTDAVLDMVNTNFIGYYLVSKAFVPNMVKRRKGRVVNVSTSLSTMTAATQMPYGPARAAAEAMSTIMSKQLEEYGIGVNVLLPGGASDTGFVPEAYRDFFIQRGGLLPPTIMNDAILFLASDEAEGLSAQRIIAKDFRTGDKKDSY